MWEYQYFWKRKLRKLNLSRKNKEERREKAPPTEEIILLKWGKRYSGEARKLPGQSCQVNWQSNPSTQPTCFPTSKLVSGHSPAWNLRLEGPFPIPSPPLSLSRGLIKLLQPPPEKAPVFAWIVHPYGLGHFRYVLPRLKVDSITTGKKTTWMSSAQCVIYSRYFVQVLSWIKLITQNYWESWLFQTRQRFAVWEIAVSLNRHFPALTMLLWLVL